MPFRKVMSDKTAPRVEEGGLIYGPGVQASQEPPEPSVHGRLS